MLRRCDIERINVRCVLYVKFVIAFASLRKALACLNKHYCERASHLIGNAATTDSETKHLNLCRNMLEEAAKQFSAWGARKEEIRALLGEAFAITLRFSPPLVENYDVTNLFRRARHIVKTVETLQSES